MIKNLWKAGAPAFMAAALCLGMAPSARALIISGTWDPPFGSPFDNPGQVLGWRGTAQWFVPDTCLPAAGTVLNSAACSGGAMSMLGAQVDFYDVDTTLSVGGLTYGAGSAAVTSVDAAGMFIIGVDTALSTSLTPSATFAGIDAFAFSLKFAGDGVQLFYSALADDCEPGAQRPPSCGVNDPRFRATVKFTTAQAVNEPAPAALLLAGLGLLGWMRRRERSAAGLS